MDLMILLCEGVRFLCLFGVLSYFHLSFAVPVLRFAARFGFNG